MYSAAPKFWLAIEVQFQGLYPLDLGSDIQSTALRMLAISENVTFTRNPNIHGE